MLRKRFYGLAMTFASLGTIVGAAVAGDLGNPQGEYHFYADATCSSKGSAYLARISIQNRTIVREMEMARHCGDITEQEFDNWRTAFDAARLAPCSDPRKRDLINTENDLAGSDLRQAEDSARHRSWVCR